MTLQRLETAKKVAVAIARAQGGAAGLVAGAALAKPNLLGKVISLPLGTFYYPIYCLSGQREANQRLKVLELVAANASQAHADWWKGLKGNVLTFDGLEVRLSENYLSILKDALGGGASTSSTPARVLANNPIPPSLCTIAELVDPFNERYTMIVLNDTARMTVYCVCMVAILVSGVYLLIKVFRLSVKGSLFLERHIRRVIREEKEILDTKHQPPVANVLRMLPNPAPEIEPVADYPRRWPVQEPR